MKQLRINEGTEVWPLKKIPPASPIHFFQWCKDVFTTAGVLYKMLFSIFRQNTQVLGHSERVFRRIKISRTLGRLALSRPSGREHKLVLSFQKLSGDGYRKSEKCVLLNQKCRLRIYSKKIIKDDEKLLLVVKTVQAGTTIANTHWTLGQAPL